MASRLNLQNELERILGSRNVYFQPPESLMINYDAIVYSLDGVETLKANNKNYKLNKAYKLTHIHEDPDSEIHETLLSLPYCKFDRRFVSDNLYHDVYTLYH